jgi:hypothetical protein
LAGNRIFAVNVLNDELLEKAKALGIDTIVSNERSISKLPEGITFVNSEVYRVPGTWEAYAYNTNVINHLYLKTNSRFRINGIDIYKAMPKLIYWTNYKIGYLYACIKDQFKKENVVYIPPYLSPSRLKETIKYFRNFLVNNTKSLIRHNSSIRSYELKGRKIGIWVNDAFELGIFEYLIKAIPAKELVLFHFGNIDFEKFRFVTNESLIINIGRIKKYSPQFFINPFRLSTEELSVVNTVSHKWQDISTELEQYKYIKNTGIKSIIINVGENLPLKNLMMDVFNGKINVYNTMNGNKAGEAHDSDVHFTKWLIWDKEMETLLIKKCHIDPAKLYITGHLMQDYIKEYKFINSISIDNESIKNKKVISVFSVRGNREEKKKALSYLFDLVEKDRSYFLMIRPHPSEKAEDIVIPSNLRDNIRLITYNWENSKQTLYDQIYLSDIGIVFGSTVALECKWMHIPALTYELKTISDIYCIDGIFIKHVHSIQELKDIIQKLEKKKIAEKTERVESVAEKIIKVINDDLSSKNNI